jgi:hypothetical protein
VVESYQCQLRVETTRPIACCTLEDRRKDCARPLTPGSWLLAPDSWLLAPGSWLYYRTA